MQPEILHYRNDVNIKIFSGILNQPKPDTSDYNDTLVAILRLHHIYVSRP